MSGAGAMSPQSTRFRTIAATMTARVHEVPAERWDAPAPCEGWVARDIVRHLAEWMVPMFVEGIGVPAPTIPSADDDPAGTWDATCAALQGVLDDPELAARPVTMPFAEFPAAEAIDRFGTTDILIHTWDLARATGLDETLDADEVHDALVGMEPIAEVLASSGHYGPRTTVDDDADEQTRLIALTGRTP